MRKTAYIIIGLILLATAIAWAADTGTVTLTEETFSHVKKIKCVWLTNTSGQAEKTTTETYAGQVLYLVTVPDGTDAPTDNYDVYVKDEDGVDVLQAGGWDRDTANTEYVKDTSLGYVANDKLTLTVASGGNAKKGTVYLYIK